MGFLKNNRRLFLVCALFLLAAGCRSSSVSTPPASQKQSVCHGSLNTVNVLVKDGSFDPQEITVTQCTKVVFQNMGSQPHWPASDFHPTHGIYPEFDPLVGIQPGNSWAFTFEKIGSWKYHDHLFPTVKGIVTVTQ